MTAEVPSLASGRDLARGILNYKSGREIHQAASAAGSPEYIQPQRVGARQASNFLPRHNWAVALQPSGRLEGGGVTFARWPRESVSARLRSRKVIVFFKFVSRSLGGQLCSRRKVALVGALTLFDKPASSSFKRIAWRKTALALSCV
jgi:hypothetical protein